MVTITLVYVNSRVKITSNKQSIVATEPLKGPKYNSPLSKQRAYLERTLTIAARLSSSAKLGRLTKPFNVLQEFWVCPLSCFGLLTFRYTDIILALFSTLKVYNQIFC